MARYGFRTRQVIVVVLTGCVVVAGCGLWLQWTRIRVWYALRNLSSVSAEEREQWAEGVAKLGEPVVPALLEALSQDDAHSCQNATAALDHLSRHWGLEDEKTVALLGKLTRSWGKMSTAGQEDTLQMVAGWFDRANPPTCAVELRCQCGLLIQETREVKSPSVQIRALELCAIVQKQPWQVEVHKPVRVVLRTGLRSSLASNRLLAIRLALHPPRDLLPEVVPLLKDPSASIRRAALIAVGPEEKIILDDELLPLLHDADKEVRRVCRLTLLGRGLRPEHIKLGKLLTHPDATERLNVLDQLGKVPELDPGLWLLRLSHDPSPAVRAAALRAMSKHTTSELTNRIHQIALNDPSPTVSQLARYYGKQAQRTRYSLRKP